MNTLKFLLSLKDTNQYINFGSSDLDTLVDNFKPEVFDDYFKDFPIKGKDFLNKLTQDINTASVEDVNSMIAFLQEVLTNRYNSFEEKPLLKTLKIELKKYIINNYQKMNIKNYSKFLILCVVDDLQKDLNYRISLNFNQTKNDFLAGTFFENSVHNLEYNKLPVLQGFPSNQIFQIFVNMYHEQYHMLVAELANNPSCYKIDILKYSIFNQLRLTMKNPNLSKQLYDVQYFNLKEEMNANLYGIKRAKKELLAINPNFKVLSISNIINIPSYKAVVVNNAENYSAKISQDDYFENLLDKVMLKDLTFDSEMPAIMKKIYNADGTRKNFQELYQDLKMALASDMENQASDIYNFYYYAIYRYLKQMDFATYQAFVVTLNEEELQLLENVLGSNIGRLNDELTNLNSTHLYKLKENIKKHLTKKIIKNELSDIYTMQNEINYLKLKGENLAHGKH